MPERVVLARRDGPDATVPTPALTALLRRLGGEVVARASQSRREHNRYAVGPALVDQVRAHCRDHDADTVVVDGHLHEGQVVDLADALPVETVWDRRDVVWAALAAGGNDVAAARRSLRTGRVERRRVAAARRTAAAEGPDTDDGRLADLDRRRDRHEAALADARETARRAAREAYTDVDAHVVVVGATDASTTPVWAALCDRSAEGENGEGADTGPVAPATTTTAVTRLGASEVAVSDGPGLVGGDAAWYDGVVPDWTATVERAAVLVAVADGTRAGAALQSACDRVDAPVVAVTPDAAAAAPSTRVTATLADTGDGPPVDRLRGAVADALPETGLVATLPYRDEAHTVVSWLHDRGTVAAVDYDDQITVRVAVPASATEAVRSRVTSAGGSVAMKSD